MSSSNSKAAGSSYDLFCATQNPTTIKKSQKTKNEQKKKKINRTK
jgi:hypothetical protein